MKLNKLYDKKTKITPKDIFRSKIKTLYPHLEILDIIETKEGFIAKTKLARICGRKEDL